MRGGIVFILFLILIPSLACQTLTPKGGPSPISNCHELVNGVKAIQPDKIPEYMMNGEDRLGTEFDANQYFSVLPDLGMQDGYVLDYHYFYAGLGAGPELYAHLSGEPPLLSAQGLPPGTKLADYQGRLVVEDTPQGYFQNAVLSTMASQFYLYWHANYNDDQIICDAADVKRVIESINDEEFGKKFSALQALQARSIPGLEPSVELLEDQAVVRLVIFTKWGGFYRRTFTIDRAFPHTLNMEDENLVQYDCGIMF